ncbi:MAG: Uncharacterised protein [Cryomorphaceae bacterium]|nr:MAG: Uncharacterised protein [Cryomorphaceae bacterium]
MSGNTSALTQDIVVTDTIAPYITQQLGNTFYLDENSCVYYLEAWRDSLAFADNCGSAVTLTSARPANLFLNKGAHTITYTLTDDKGNDRIYNHMVNIVDTISPELINMPAAITAYATASDCGTSVQWTPPTPSDNCVGFVLTGTAKSGDYFNLGTTTVVYTLVDAVGLTVMDSFDITVIDTISPVLATKNATVVLDASGSASIVLSDVLLSAVTDNCSLSSTSLDVSSFGCSDLGANTVTITSTDVNGNVSTATSIVTVVDNAVPVVSTQNATVYLDASGSASLAVSDVHASSSDNCGVSATTVDVTSFGCSDLGANTVTVSSTDASGNTGTATATVTVLDTITPSLVVPSNALVAYATSSCSAVVNYAGVSSTDNCGTPVVSYDVASGSTFNVGTTTVTATSTDGSGNTVSATFDVTVLDTVSPYFVNVPTSAVITADSVNCGATVTWASPSAVDNCSATVTADTASGSFFAVGTHTVTFTALDASGNSGTATLTFTVSDVIDPILSNIPADITVYASANQCSETVNWTPITGTDNCSAVTVTTSETNGGTFALGTTTVSVEAEDAAGNTANGSFKVHVLDTVSPTWVYVPMDTTIGSCNSAVVYALPAASDNCLGVTVAQTAGLPSGAPYPIGTTTNTFVATDASGNTSTVSFDVVIVGSNVSYTQTVFEVCKNDPPVDISDANYSFSFSGQGVTDSLFDPRELSSGMYIVSYDYVDSLGCTSQGTFSIVVNGLPIQPQIARLSSTVLALNNTYSSYQWRKNGVNIPGETQPTYTVKSAGYYDCVVGNGICTVASDKYAFGNVGIDEVEEGTYLVYPNPSHGRFKLVHGFGNEESMVQVVNLLGQTIYQTTTTNSVIEIDLSDKAQGSYILILRNAQNEVHQPIKIQR